MQIQRGGQGDPRHLEEKQDGPSSHGLLVAHHLAQIPRTFNHLAQFWRALCPPKAGMLVG
jgi:hypothetical protein